MFKVQIKERLPQVGSKSYQFEIISSKFIIDQNLYNKKIDFIIDDNLNLKFGIGHYKLNNKNETLIMAGNLIINNNGKISYISNDSGHYQPNHDQFKIFLKSSILPQALFDKNYKIEMKTF